MRRLMRGKGSTGGIESKPLWIAHQAGDQHRPPHLIQRGIAMNEHVLGMYYEGCLMCKHHTEEVARLINYACGLLGCAEMYLRSTKDVGPTGTPPLVRDAKECIRRARAMYKAAMQLASKHGLLSHHYAGNGSNWVAVVRVGNAVAWYSSRTYGKRQSAQRAAKKNAYAMQGAWT